MRVPPSFPSPEQPELLFGDVQDYLDRATALLAEGDMEALMHLGPQVDVLCEKLAALAESQTNEYQPEILHLVAGLSELVNAMNATKTTIANALKSAGSHHRAARAYLTTAPVEE